MAERLVPTTIAIDGPVASGKTVVGRCLAERLGYRFLDTGIMYRAATWAAIQHGIGLEDDTDLTALVESLDISLISGEGGDRLLVDGHDATDCLRDPNVERGVSPVSAISGVRRALVAQQRAIAGRDSIVMVGRDIGTVVLKDASVKVFLDASVEVRARRRWLEIKDKGRALDYQRVEDELIRRDKIDSERADSPLRPAEDAIIIVTDQLEINEVLDKILNIVEGRR